MNESKHWLHEKNEFAGPKMTIVQWLTAGSCVWKELIKTFGVLLIAVIITELLWRNQIGNQNIIVIYILSVLIVSRIMSGYLYGIIATLISAFVYDYLITYPRLGFSFTFGFPLTFIIMLLVTLIISTVTNQLKAQTALAIEREKMRIKQTNFLPVAWELGFPSARPLFKRTMVRLKA